MYAIKINSRMRLAVIVLLSILSISLFVLAFKTANATTGAIQVNSGTVLSEAEITAEGKLPEPESKFMQNSYYFKVIGPNGGTVITSFTTPKFHQPGDRLTTVSDGGSFVIQRLTPLDTLLLFTLSFSLLAAASLFSKPE